MASKTSASASSAMAMVDEELGDTCSYYTVQADDGTCTIEPRTCYDCLNTPLASGQECTLTPTGLCKDISSYNKSEDYRRGGYASQYPIHYNYFPALNSTYCELNDSICSRCREHTFRKPSLNPSLYCVGHEGCVCVAVCEDITWRNYALGQLETALKTQDNASDCALAENNSLNDGAIDRNHVSEPTTKNVYSHEDECMWYLNSTYCSIPRTCFDCLNTNLYSGTNCVITPSGLCTDMKFYDYSRDFRRNSSAAADHYFPSVNTTYCESDDPICVDCKKTEFNDADKNPSAYCVGENGCVCVSACESPGRAAMIQDDMCGSTGSYSIGIMNNLSDLAFIMIGCIIVFSVALGIGLRFYRKRLVARRRLEEERRQPRRAQLQLDLEGWHAMREKLITTENLSLEKMHMNVDEEPSLEVEEGGRHRSDSPSQLHEARDGPR